MRKRKMFNVLAVVAGCLLLVGRAHAQEASRGKQRDYLKVVKAYAETLMERGRDTYGAKKTPLFVASLDRKNLQPGNFPGIAGIRAHDRSLHCANPMHDENLYQVLYALTKITDDKKYAAEADKALKFFFENCQSPVTGLMAWGEHMGWHIHGERPQTEMRFRGQPFFNHEFYRPWILWDRCHDLAPDAALKFSKGLWEHQIANHETGEFSRHALWDKHGLGGGNEYPRHGGFYIMMWGKAYREAKDPVYAKAVETLVDMFNRLSPEKTGAIPCCSRPGLKHVMWPESNLSLAVDLTDAAPVFPEALRKKMLTRAAKTDEVYQSLKHDFSPEGIGFVAGANTETLAALTDGPWTHTQQWTTGYGKTTDAQVANDCHLRYGQLADGPDKKGYRKLILDCANRYLKTAPDLKGTIFPGPMGNVILHMLAAYEITSDKKYLDRADVFAAIAIDNFLTEDSALPRASSQHNHYEAITGGDTMMMALLKLWQVRNKPDLSIDLIHTDR